MAVRPTMYPMGYPSWNGPAQMPPQQMQMPGMYPQPSYGPQMPPYYGNPNMYYPQGGPQMGPGAPIAYMPVIRQPAPSTNPPPKPALPITLTAAPEPKPAAPKTEHLPAPPEVIDIDIPPRKTQHPKRRDPEPEFLDEPEEVTPPRRAGTKEPGKSGPIPKRTEPQSFAEETGQKVGDWVTQYLKDNPQWEEKIKKLNVESFLKNGLANGDFSKVTESLGGVRDNFQKSWLSRQAMKYLAKPLVHVLPGEMQPMAQQAIQWLTTKPAAGAS